MVAKEIIAKLFSREGTSSNWNGKCVLLEQWHLITSLATEEAKKQSPWQNTALLRFYCNEQLGLWN